MTEDSHFLRESLIDIDAAVVGISSKRWASIPLVEATADHAAQIMRVNEFDILPIEAEDGVREYFQTQRWKDYSAVTREKITHRDVISFKTALPNIIQGFALEPRNFYFLGSEQNIVGLISISNLNCRQVRVYLYNLLSQLEIELGKFVSGCCSDHEIIEMTFGAGQNPKHADVMKRHQRDKAKGVHVPIVEYLYLPDLLKVVVKKKLFERLGFESRKTFDAVFSPLVKLRDTVAHPARSLIKDPSACKKLWERIDKVEGILIILRQDSS